MGKQYDKVIKRRRRLAYLERLKEKAKAASAGKPRLRKPKAKVEEPAAKEAAPKKAPKPKAAPIDEVAPETEVHAEAPAEETASAPAE